MSKRRSSRSPSPPTKVARALPAETDNNVICSLPPTCHRHPCILANAEELERHYKTYHTYVCQVEGCFCVFPDDRLLELHFAECHDPLVAVRKEKGEKTFVCLIPTCPRSFATPAKRRMHLIDAHHYPKEYFFAVTNKGIGGLLEKWGEGVSLVRPGWKKDKPRPQGQDECLSEPEGSESTPGLSFLSTDEVSEELMDVRRKRPNFAHAQRTGTTSRCSRTTHMSASRSDDLDQDVPAIFLPPARGAGVRGRTDTSSVQPGRSSSKPSKYPLQAGNLHSPAAANQKGLHSDNRAAEADQMDVDVKPNSRRSNRPGQPSNRRMPTPSKDAAGSSVSEHLDAMQEVEATVSSKSGTDAALEDLSAAMSSISLVPRSVRLRGAHKPGIIRHPPVGRGAASTSPGRDGDSQMPEAAVLLLADHDHVDDLL